MDVFEISIPKIIDFGVGAAFPVLIICIIVFSITNPAGINFPPISLTGVYPIGRELLATFGSYIGLGMCILGLALFFVEKNKLGDIKSKIKSFKAILILASGIFLAGLCIFPVKTWNHKDHGINSFVSQYHDNKISTIIHISFTGLFFLTSMILFVFVAIDNYKEYKKEKTKLKRNLLFIRLILLVSVVIIYPVFSFFGSLARSGNNACGFNDVFKQSKEECVSFLFYSSFSQYFVISCIIFFFFTFRYDLLDTKLCIRTKKNEI